MDFHFDPAGNDAFDGTVPDLGLRAGWALMPVGVA